MAGLFAVYTMFSDARAFSRYVAISPSLFWDDHAMNRRAMEFGKRRDLASARLFVAVGEQETKERGIDPRPAAGQGSAMNAD
jgi:ferri-bacillibactin esterase